MKYLITLVSILIISMFIIDHNLSMINRIFYFITSNIPIPIKIILIFIIGEYLSTIIHELSHCLIHIIFARGHCECYIPWPCFIPFQIKSYKFYLGKLLLILSSKGPLSKIHHDKDINKLINALVIFNGAFFGLITLVFFRYYTDIWVFDLLFIVDLISNFFPTFINGPEFIYSDGLNIIRTYYPYFIGYNKKYSTLLIWLIFLCYMVNNYLLYYLYVNPSLKLLI
jgi:hypothetical protein